MSENSLELINEYKDQIRILRQEVAELQDAGKSKDSANKRCLQKLERTNEDLEEALKKIKLLEEKNDQKNIRKDKKSLEQIYCLAFQLAIVNFVLNLIMCSAVTNTCLPPYRYPDLFADGYSCMIAGNYESIKKLEEIGYEDINKNKIYIKFICNEEKKEEKTT